MGPAIGYIRKSLQSSYSKYIQKNETVLRKLKENTMKTIQKTENLNSNTETNKNVKFRFEKYLKDNTLEEFDSISEITDKKISKRENN